MQIKNRHIVIFIIFMFFLSFFSGRFTGNRAANKRWIGDYNTISLELEGERARTREAIREFEERIRSDGLVIDKLREDNTKLRDYVGQLEFENKRLRDIQSATESIHIRLADILRSDMEAIDKIISVARELQNLYGQVEKSNN